ncbi:MAG: metallophosphoesterase [Chlamydiales bacterium]
MRIWAIGDLHLSFGTPNKNMDVFGDEWLNHPAKIEKHWRECISYNDLVLLPGDISWAKEPEEAKPDLDWIDALPGIKVMIKGNHDYWWGSQRKMKGILPSSLHAIHNSHFRWGDIEICGTRLWDSEEYNFDPFDDKREEPVGVKISPEQHDLEANARVFARELHRLDLSLRQMEPGARLRIAMTHYPPIGANLEPSATHKILKKHNIDICVFGHLHGLIPNSLPFGECEGIRYVLTSCDYINFKPVLISQNSGY